MAITCGVSESILYSEYDRSWLGKHHYLQLCHKTAGNGFLWQPKISPTVRFRKASTIDYRCCTWRNRSKQLAVLGFRIGPKFGHVKAKFCAIPTPFGTSALASKNPCLEK